MCDYANLHRYTYVFIFVLCRYIQRGPFVHFLYVCVHMCSPLRTPPISAWQRDKFTLRSSPVDMQGAWKITIDIAMVTVALLLPETYNATMQCMPECVCVCLFVPKCMYLCVKEMEWGVAVAYRGWMFFSRGIVCDTAGRWQGLQPQPEVNNMTTLLVPVQKSLYISEWLPWQLGAESGPNFVLDSLIQMSCSAFCGRFLLNVFCLFGKRKR